MIDASALTEMKGRVRSWLKSREDISERESALINATHYTEWESSDDEAVAIVHDLAVVLGVGLNSD